MKIIFLHWCSLQRKDSRDNYGDMLSKYLVKKLSKGLIIKVNHPSKRIYKYLFKNFIAIGSIITRANINTIVWGSGIIKRNEHIRNAKFLAVRGPITRKRILELGFNAPEIYGDPAILLPFFYKNEIKNKKFKIGIAPHIVDFEEVYEFCNNDKRIKVIDLLTSNVEFTTNEILECDMIISSSLHGLIISHAYNIPALWVKFSEKLSGDDVKFYDYFESLEIKYENEIFMDLNMLSFDNIKIILEKNTNKLLPLSEIFNLRQKELFNSCPFNK